MMMLKMRAIFFSLLFVAMLFLAVCVPAAALAAAGDDLGGGGTLCVQKASTQAYDGVVALQDGTGRLVLWNKNGGQAWLATMDTAGDGSSVVLRVGDKAFIDLGRRVSHDAARGRGLAGVAVHSSGQLLFVSYYTTAAAPNESSLLVVDQLLSSSASWNDKAITTTRVVSIPLPQAAAGPRSSSSGFPLDYYGGQIMFRPTATDPFLYVVTGAAAQTDGQLQTEILRFRVGDLPSSGNRNETYAAILGIPRRCAFDADQPGDLYCAMVKDGEEHVYLISDPDAPSLSAPPPNPSLLVANQLPTPGTPPSLVGGLLYRGSADKSLDGSYIYMDGSELWVTEASPQRNHSTTRNLRVACSSASTSPCSGGSDYSGGAIASFGEDADKNALLLATDAVYLVVGPTACDKPRAPPTSNNNVKNLLTWIIGLIAALASLGAAGYVCKKCGCYFSRNKYVNVIRVGDNAIVGQIIQGETVRNPVWRSMG